MENLENTYCRFCAESKSSNKQLNLQNDEQTWRDITLKLAYLNTDVIDNTLPKTVCFVCYESLNKAYEFLNKVKKAQDVLKNIIGKDNKYDSDDDRITALDEFLSNNAESDDVPEIKQETSSPDKQKQLDVNIYTTIEVKNEPKEEMADSEPILEEPLHIPPHDLDQTLNVQDILDAAICGIAPDVTLYAKELSKNIKSWKDYPWLCSYCNIEFLDIDMLRAHTKSVHEKCSAFSCIDCKTLWKKDDFNLFINHVRKHRKSLRNRCHYCDTLLKIGSLATHVKQHFQKSHIPCPICGEILRNEEALKAHIREYNTKKPKRRPRRKPGTPLTIEDLTCDICKKIYKNPNSLRDHMKRHTTERKRNYTCERCGKMFYSKGSLTSHIMTHDEIRPHTCRICNKSFLFPNMLRRHVEMHSGVKPFSCEQCGRCFRLQYQLNAHKIVHTDSMPFVCQYCNKAFRYKQILKNHERQHTGAKPYSCPHCGMQFTNWSNFNKHMKRRHNTDTSKKKITPEGVFPVNPETGVIIHVQDAGMEEWRSKIMLPAKRGKKKVIKQENS